MCVCTVRATEHSAHRLPLASWKANWPDVPRQQREARSVPVTIVGPGLRQWGAVQTPLRSRQSSPRPACVCLAALLSASMANYGPGDSNSPPAVHPIHALSSLLLLLSWLARGQRRPLASRDGTGAAPTRGQPPGSLAVACPWDGTWGLAVLVGRRLQVSLRNPDAR